MVSRSLGSKNWSEEMSRGLDNYQFIVSGINLSDLFFNYEHPERDKLYEQAHKGGRSGQIDDHDLDRARMLDANGFIDSLAPSMQGDARHSFAMALIEDFNRRV